jgi:hypothetical protein
LTLIINKNQTTKLQEFKSKNQEQKFRTMGKKNGHKSTKKSSSPQKTRQLVMLGTYCSPAKAGDMDAPTRSNRSVSGHDPGSPIVLISMIGPNQEAEYPASLSIPISLSLSSPPGLPTLPMTLLSPTLLMTHMCATQTAECNAMSLNMLSPHIDTSGQYIAS